MGPGPPAETSVRAGVPCVQSHMIWMIAMIIKENPWKRRSFLVEKGL